jgi:hypothetical protein
MFRQRGKAAKKTQDGLIKENHFLLMVEEAKLCGFEPKSVVFGSRHLLV